MAGVVAPGRQLVLNLAGKIEVINPARSIFGDLEKKGLVTW